MYSWENPDDRVAIVQIEFRIAACATGIAQRPLRNSHQLRLRFSADDLARFGQRDILHKSVQAASALNEYYSSIEKKIPVEETASAPLPRLTEAQILDAVQRVSSYLHEQREHYFPSAAPSPTARKSSWRHISRPRFSIT